MTENKDSYITIEIDNDLYKDLLIWCEKNNTTLEKITEQFIRFSANPANRETIIKWYEKYRDDGSVSVSLSL